MNIGRMRSQLGWVLAAGSLSASLLIPGSAPVPTAAPAASAAVSEVRYGHPTLYAKDVNVMMNFYQEALGFQTLYQFPEAGSATFGTSKLGTFYVTFATYKAIRESTSIPSIGRASQRQMDIAILVDDVDAAVARAEAAGAKLAMAPKEQPWGERQAFVYDPEKNLVQISTHRGG